jgi:hypothetical protein
LQDKYILSPNVLKDFHHHFAIAETAHHRPSDADAEMPYDILGKPGIGVAGKNHQAIVGHGYRSSPGGCH